jgi:hypothetical protein
MATVDRKIKAEAPYDKKFADYAGKQGNGQIELSRIIETIGKRGSRISQRQQHSVMLHLLQPDFWRVSAILPVW